jgi:hypothetical protein
MSHTVEIPDDLFARLQQWAEPLVDNTVSLIAKLADYYEAGHSPAPPNVVSPASTAPRSAARDFSGVRPPPSLTHTKVLSMQIGGAPLRNPSWNGLLFELARRAQGRVNGGGEIRRLVIVNYVSGQGDPSKGYHFVPELGISVQGQDANYAWKGAAHLARELNIPVAAEFVWKDKPGAAHPGVIGRLAA